MTTHSTSADRLLERAIRFGIAVVGAEGIRRRDPSAVVNAAVALGTTFLPRRIERRYGVKFRPWQRIYTEIAMLTHSIGMLGPYDNVWWWDHLTHAHSATLLGGLAHVVARRNDRDPNTSVIAVVVGGSVIWELLEYAAHAGADRLGVEPLLVNYGRADTIRDLVFNFVGAVLVLVFGDEVLENVVQGSE